ncbi:Hypothetical protein HVR_LOCUS281 [uncultured virus]|nr:Hypothetical protein HVR_LOCUS281 [uncultured virus]
MSDHHCNVCDKFKKYKCKQYNDLKPPNISGKWDRTNFYYIIHNNPEIAPFFKDIAKLDDEIITITQCGVFIIFEAGQNLHRPVAIDRLGIWNPIRAGDGSIFSWQLTVVDGDDSQTDIIQISKSDRNGKATQLYGSVIESGFNKDNPLQVPTVGYYYMDLI